MVMFDTSSESLKKLLKEEREEYIKLARNHGFIE